MVSTVAISCFLGFAVLATAQLAAKRLLGAGKDAGENGYLSESPLPKGWPEPGPYDEVALKKYPAYRAAFSTGGRPNGEFMTLFRHIRRNDIPMTAPVEMTLDQDEKESAKMEGMAFLYQDASVGKTGADGKDVEVRDVEAVEALSYAWNGSRKDVAKARGAIDAELRKRGLKASGYRLLGYNSPMVPNSRKTHELQALIERK